MKKSKRDITYKATDNQGEVYLPYKNGFIVQTVLPVRVVNGCVSTVRDNLLGGDLVVHTRR